MDTTSVRCLINSISRFIHLVSCQSIKVVPVEKDYRNMVVALKLLKLLLDDVVDCEIPSDEILYKECEELDMLVNEAREFMENWCPKMSKIHRVSLILILGEMIPKKMVLETRISFQLIVCVFWFSF